MVTVLAPAKLTVSLKMAGLRDDGMHLIRAEMVSLDFFDSLSIEPVTAEPAASSVVMDGPAAGVMRGRTDGTDLVTAALDLVDRRADVVVDKQIPAGAGLGGGSSDAAAILRWAGFTDTSAAARIGADVAFCLVGGRAEVTGIGEAVAALPHRARTFTLLTPPIHCSTPAVYRRWDEMGGPTDPDPFGNDLTAAAVDAYPEMAEWRDALESLTGERARLAGSGSTWFVEGEFEGPDLRVVRSIPALA